MTNMIVTGKSERRENHTIGKYNINLDIIADIDDIAEVREEIMSALNREPLGSYTYEILLKVIHELEAYDEII